MVQTINIFYWGKPEKFLRLTKSKRIHIKQTESYLYDNYRQYLIQFKRKNMKYMPEKYELHPTYFFNKIFKGQT